MSATPGLAGTNQTLGAIEETIYDKAIHGPSPTTMMIRNRVDSGAVLVVRIPELHGAAGGATLPVGEKEPFRVDTAGFSKIFVTGNTAKIDWYGVARVNG